MAAQRSIRAGAAFIELFLRDNAVRSGLIRIDRQLQSFGRGITRIGAGITGVAAAVGAPLLAMAREFANAGDAVEKMAARTGFSAEALSQLGFAAEQTGSNIETLERGITGQIRSIRNLEQGLSTAVDAFDDLGITYAEIRDLRPEDQFLLIADRLSQIEDPTRRAGIALQVFGRAGRDLGPLLASGADGIRELMAEADALGLTISGDLARAAAEQTDAMNRLFRTFRAVRVVIGSGLTRDITTLANRIAIGLRGVIDWARENGNLIRSLARIAVGAAAFGAGIIAIGASVIFLGASIGSIATIMGALASTIGVVGSALAALVSPIGLTIAAMTTLGAVIVRQTSIGSTAVEFLKNAFLRLRDDAVATFQGIADALAAGNISLAARILWLALRVEWERGIAFLNQKWEEWKAAFLQTAADARFGAAVAFSEAFAGIETAWVRSVGFLIDTWDTFIANIRTTWQATTTFLADKLLPILKLFDETIDVAAAREVLQEDLRRDTQSRSRELEQRVSQREQERQARLQQIEEDRLRRQERLAELNAERTRRISEGQNQAIADSTRDLESARAEWNDALRAAAAAREAATEAPGAIAAAGTDFLDAIASIQSGAGQLAARGTFEGAIAERIFGTGTADVPRQQLNVARDQLTEQRRTNQKLDGLRGPAFGA